MGPEILAVRLSGEAFKPTLIRHAFFRAFQMLDAWGLSKACAAMMDEVPLLPAKEVFWRGRVAVHVRCVIRGKLRYFHSDGSKEEVERGAWLSEAALWLKWRHRGSLHSELESGCTLM